MRWPALPRRRNSSFIDGVGRDAEAITTGIVQFRAAARRVRAGMNLALSYDVIVVGARCGGRGDRAAAGPRRGAACCWSTAAHGSDTLSTHALMRGGVLQLAHGACSTGWSAAGTPAVRRTTFHYGREAVAIDIKAAARRRALMRPRRTLLDPMLGGGRGGGRRRGALRGCRRGCAARRRRPRAGVAVTAGGARGCTRRLVIGADGLRSTVARAVGAPMTLRGRRGCAVRYGYCRRARASAATTGTIGRKATAGAIPTNDGLHVRVCRMPRHGSAAARRFARGAGRGASAACAGELAAGARRPPRPAPSPAARVPAPAGGPGWALVGDAGYFKDPITAHGITDALRDAELLARAVLAGTDASMAAYETTRDTLSRPLFAATDALAGLAWSFGKAKALHADLNKAMKAEQEWLAAGAEPFARAA